VDSLPGPTPLASSTSRIAAVVLGLTVDGSESRISRVGHLNVRSWDGGADVYSGPTKSVGGSARLNL
jgi:hypothetical protein